jgi:hypothetical protein
MAERFVSPLTGDKLTEGEAHLFLDSYRSKQTGPKRSDCYICRDPDFAQMGLPLCTACSKCKGHVPADDSVRSDCGHDQYEDYEDTRP